MNFLTKVFVLMLSLFILTGCSLYNENNNYYEEKIVKYLDRDLDKRNLINIQSEKESLFFYKNNETLYLYIFEGKELSHSSSFNFVEMGDEPVFWQYNGDDLKNNRSIIWGITTKDSILLNNQQFKVNHILIDDVDVFYKILNTKLDLPIRISAT